METTMHTEVHYTVRLGDIALDSFSATSLGDAVALANARAFRDAYRASEFGQRLAAPLRIVRSKRTRRVNPL
jgi:hypothetical protein